MSAVRQDSLPGDSSDVHNFIQKIPIQVQIINFSLQKCSEQIMGVDYLFQSYLIAIAVGKIESRKIGPRSHVWSEKVCIFFILMRVGKGGYDKDKRGL